MLLMLAMAMVMQGGSVETLAAPMPSGFKVGHQAAQGGQTIEERVPVAETVEAWSQMITVQRFAGLAPVGPHRLLDRLSGLMATACPGATAAPVVDGIEGGHPIATLRVDCPMNAATGKPETMFARAFGGATDIHLVQYAYRSTPTSQQSDTATDYIASVHLRDAGAAR